MRLKKWFNLMLGVVALATPAAAFAATKPGLQFQVDGVGAGPVGKYPSYGNIAASRLYSEGPGPGFMVGASMGLTSHFVLGVRTGIYHNEKSDVVPLFPGVILRRKLTSIPVHTVLQYRGRLPWWKLGMYVESGVGVTSHTARAEIDIFDPPVVVSRYQKDFAFLGGAGLSCPAMKGVDVILSSDYHQALTRDGDVWKGGDNPKAIVVSLGIRFPQY